MAYQRMPSSSPQRVSLGGSGHAFGGSSTSTGSVSMSSVLRVMGVAIVALALVSLSLQGYGLLNARERHAVVTVESAPRGSAAPPVMLRTTPDETTPIVTMEHKIQDVDEDTEENCYDERDWGLIARIKESARVFCGDVPPDQRATPTAAKVTLFKEPHGIFQATVYDRLVLDLRGVQVFKPIRSIAQDGGRHDPRFKFLPTTVQCECEALHQFAVDEVTQHNRTLQLWHSAWGNMSTKTDPPSTVCAVGGPAGTPMTGVHTEIKEKTLLIVRKDDHNPFFQVSSALNAWLLLKVLNWDVNEDDVRVIHLDGGYPSPIDELHRRLLSPKMPLLNAGQEYTDRRLEFTNGVALVPFETTGPMMQHLNDDEPCGASELFVEFRKDALGVMDLPPLPAKRTQVTITVITRRNYGGRRVQRTWRNEKDILDQMRELYRTARDSVTPIVIQSVDFVTLSLREQMWIMLNSDVVIGMHGAGMVNVLWTRPGTLVVEIFPKRRKRWGYRNLCQHLGCNWKQFRGGKDTGRGDNNSHKLIPWDEWHAFFGPLFQETLQRVAEETQ